MVSLRRRRLKQYADFATSVRLLRSTRGLSTREVVSIALSVAANRTFFYWGRTRFYIERRADGPFMLVHQDLVDSVLAVTNLAPQSFIVDIGGHIGQFARCVLRRLPDAQIVTFEPNKGSLTTLNRNLAGATQCRVLGVGIGSQAGPQRMFHLLDLSGQSSRHKRAATLRIDQTSDLIESYGEFVTRGFVESVVEGRRIDLMKIDVEGDERHVLEQVWHLPWVHLLIEVDEERAIGFDSVEAVAQFLSDREISVRTRKILSPTSDGSIYDVLVSRLDCAEHA